MRKISTGINVGGSSILVIFVLLCLTTFATLSMVSANADYKLTQKTAAASYDYYQADSRAEEILAEIGAAVNEAGDDFSRLSSGVELLEGVDYSPVSPTSALFHYSVPVDETKALSVSVQFSGLGTDANSFEIQQWKVISTAEDDFEEEWSMNVWDGTF